MKTHPKSFPGLSDDHLKNIQETGLAILPWMHVDPVIDILNQQNIDISCLISWEHLQAEADESVVPQKDTIPHLKITAYDTEDPQEKGAPQFLQVVFALGFASAHKGITIINCHAGKSRSTAFAYALLCHRMGPGKEEQAMKQVLTLRPNAAPNILIVKHADDFLKRNGKMVETILNDPGLSEARGKAERARWLWKAVQDQKNNPGGYAP